MNRMLAAAFVMAVAACADIPVTAQQGPVMTPEMKAQQAAVQGPGALRRFIDRTRMIYGFYFYDFVKRD